MKKSKRFFLLLGILFFATSCSGNIGIDNISTEELVESRDLLYDRLYGDATDNSNMQYTMQREEWLEENTSYVSKDKQMTVVPEGDDVANLVYTNANGETTYLYPDEDRPEKVVIVPRSNAATFRVNFSSDRTRWGLYTLRLKYYLPAEKYYSNGLVAVRINNSLPYVQAENVVLPLFFEDAVNYNEDGSKNFDEYVNKYNDQMFPQQRIISKWAEVNFNSSFYDTAESLLFFLNRNQTTISITNMSDSEMYFGELTLVPYNPLPTYSEYRQTVPENLGQGNYELNATDYTYKNNNEVRLGNEMTPSVTPYNSSRKLLNVLVGWDQAGRSVSWNLTVDEPGLYPLTFHYYNGNDNIPVFRSIYINGEVPFADFLNYSFPITGSKYNNETLHNEDGTLYYYFEANKVYEITLVSEIDSLSATYRNLMMIYDDITAFAVDIRKLTGATIDTLREYKLTSYYPQLPTILEAYKSILSYEYNRLMGITKSSSSAVLSYFNRMFQLLDEFIRYPDDIPLNLSKFSAGDSCLAKLIADTATTAISSSMVLDTIYVTNNSDVVRDANAGFWAGIKNDFNTLVSTFTDDRYRTIIEEDALNIWVNRSMSYIELMQTMVDQLFTPSTGIKVNIRMMPGEQNLILANAANQTPDMAMGINAGLPFEFALRGDAAYPMSDFEDFWEVASRVPQGQLLTFLYQDKFYGLPETSTTSLMFYRSDTLAGFGNNGEMVTIPKTWDEVIGLLPILQSYGMNFYYPLSATGSLKPLSNTTQLILQNGGKLFSDDGFSVELRDPNTINGIETLTKLYTIYSLPTEVASFYNSFRYNTLPMGIADLGMYLQLKYVAPELTGKWEVASIPGVRQNCSISEGTCTDLNGDGTADEYAKWFIANGSGTMIFKNTQKPNEAWEFYKWWMSTDVQVRYANDLISTFGPSFVWFSANKAAIERLPIDENIRNIVIEQMTWITDIQQVPGMYMLQRGLSDIWNVTVFGRSSTGSASTRLSVSNAIDLNKVLMDREIQRKMDEFGYYDYLNQVALNEYKIRSYEWVGQCINNYSNNTTTTNSSNKYCPI